MADKIRIDRDVEMQTRDGVTLRADIARPDTRRRVPAIVLRTPYDKRQRMSNYSLLPALMACAEGFAFVVQDVRGRYASEGEFDHLKFEVELPDSVDCIEWLSEEPWCDGSVGMVGWSYEAAIQLMAARARPKGLKAIAPAGIATPETTRLSTMRLETIILGWTALAAMDRLDRKLRSGELSKEAYSKAMSENVIPVMQDPVSAAWTLPLDQLSTLTIPGMPSYAEVVDQLLQAADTIVGGEEEVDVPALLTTGWYEPPITEVYRGLRDRARSTIARLETKMIIGPWSHTASNYDWSLGERGFGQLARAAEASIPQLHLRFFAKHLCGEVGADVPNLRYFVMGSNTWKDGADWPLPSSTERRLFLHSDGEANTVSGNGRLSWDLPINEPVDRYEYDPATPAPSWGGDVAYFGGKTLPGPFDQRRIEERRDVLVYTSQPLAQQLEIVGPLELRLFASSSALDTDFIAKLCDVDEAGISLSIADGIIRARWREGWPPAGPKFLEPNKIYEFRINLGATGNVFQPGHRLRIQITSSAFPHWERNLNTGHPAGADAQGIVAEQTVYHSGKYASHVILPVQVAV